MKKLFYICMACLAVFGFASCEPEGMVDNTPVSGHPEQDVAGVYVGTWTRILEKDTVSGEGTIILSADTTYVVNVEVSAVPAINLDAMTSVANIAQDSHYGTKFYNNSATNGFGTIFRGGTTNMDNGEDELKISFIKTVKVGRKSYNYNYSFEGVKTKE